MQQKRPVFCAPHEQVQGRAAGWGLGFPQLPQKRPVFCAPHEQVQASATVPAAPGAPGAPAVAPSVAVLFEKIARNVV